MNPLIQLKRTPPFLIALTLLWFGFLPRAQAVVPPPDGGYPGFNTAEGQNALLSLTTGAGNTAVGWFSLSSDTTGSFNTAIGTGALLFNTADENTAVGAAALLFNSNGFKNTAVGITALTNNSTGSFNTATGDRALLSNTLGQVNTANGSGALFSNTEGSFNTAMGQSALSNNISGNINTALGASAGQGVTTASNVICIGAPGANVDNSCYIGSIFGQTSSGGTAVSINADGKLGTSTSSERFKEAIKPMDKASEALLSLKPVIFRYKNEIDAAGTTQFGLVAEEVEKVNRDLVVRDKEGKPYTVRYDAVNAMLLNEFLKEHKTVQEQGATIAQLKKDLQANAAQHQEQLDALTVALQKVSAQLEASKPAPQVVNNP